MNVQQINNKGLATRYEIQDVKIGDNYLTVGFAPDGQYLIPSVEVLINKTSYEQLDGERLGSVHEDGLVAHTLTDYVNNYTDGQGYVDDLVWSNLFPKVKTSMATGRFGSKTKGLFIRKHGLYDQVGCHILIGDGQDKNHKTVIRELCNGDLFLVTTILHGKKNSNPEEIGLVPTQYCNEHWEDKNLMKALTDGSHEIYEKLYKLDPETLLLKFPNREEGQSYDSEDVESGLMDDDYNFKLTKVINSLKGNIIGTGVYESQVRNLVSNTVSGIKNMDFFMSRGVLDYFFIGDPLLHLKQIELGIEVMTAELALEHGLNPVGVDEIVVPTTEGLYEGPVMLARTPISSSLSLRKVNAVYHEEYANRCNEYLYSEFSGCQIRSALDLNTLCQDGADFDGDRCKIILNPDIQFLESNNPYKIDGWLTETWDSETGEIEEIFHDSCPYFKD